MLASPNTYCDPAVVTRTLAMLDRMSAEDCVWHRTPNCLRRWISGFPAVVVTRKGLAEPVLLGDLTPRELDTLLSVPALDMAVSL